MLISYTSNTFPTVRLFPPLPPFFFPWGIVQIVPSSWDFGLGGELRLGEAAWQPFFDLDGFGGEIPYFVLLHNLRIWPPN
jgi:hypothetical protein